LSAISVRAARSSPSRDASCSWTPESRSSTSLWRWAAFCCSSWSCVRSCWMVASLVEATCADAARAESMSAWSVFARVSSCAICWLCAW